MNHIKIATELENENTMGIKESQDVFFKSNQLCNVMNRGCEIWLSSLLHSNYPRPV